MAARMVQEHVASTMVVVHEREDPTSEEWDAYIAACRQLGRRIKRVLVLTAGGSLNARQRKEVEALFGKVPIAVLTDSIVARGAVTALSWFNVPIAAFPPSQVERALDHLQVPAVERAEVVAVLNRARARLL
jgi:hypothetical protein